MDAPLPGQDHGEITHNERQVLRNELITVEVNELMTVEVRKMRCL